MLKTETPAALPSSSESIQGSFFFSVFIDVFSVAAIVPLQPLIGEALGCSPLLYGTLMSLYGFAQLLTSPLIGTLSDTVGCKSIMLVSVFGSACSLALLVASLACPSVIAFSLSRFVSGCTRHTMTVGSATISRAYSSDVIDINGRRRLVASGLSRLHFAAASAWTLGPSVGTLLYSSVGAAAFPISFAVLNVFNGFLMARVFPVASREHRVEQRHEKVDSLGMLLASARKHGWAVLCGMLLTMFFFSLAYVLHMFYFSQILRERFGFSIANIGVVLGLSSGMNALCQAFGVNALLRRVEFSCAAAISMGALCAACLGMSFLGNATLFVFADCLALCAHSIVETAIRTIFATLFPSAISGQVMSVVYGVDGINRVVAPLLGGVFLSFFPLTFVLYVRASLCIAGTLIFVGVVGPKLFSGPVKHSKPL